MWQAAVYAMHELNLAYHKTHYYYSVAALSKSRLARHVSQLGTHKVRWELHPDAAFILSLPHSWCPTRLVATVNAFLMRYVAFPSHIRHLDITFDKADTPIHGVFDRIAEMMHVTHVSINIQFHSDSLYLRYTPFARIRTLQVLSIMAYQFSVTQCRELRELPQPQLQLDLQTPDGYTGISEDAILALLGHPTQLTATTLTRQYKLPLTPKIEERIAEWTTAHELHVAFSKMSSLGCLFAHVHLHTLALGSAFSGFEHERTGYGFYELPTFDVLQSCPLLTRLDLSNCRVNDRTLTGMFAHLTRLEQLRCWEVNGFDSFDSLRALPSPLLLRRLEVNRSMYGGGPKELNARTILESAWMRFRNLTWISAIHCFSYADQCLLTLASMQHHFPHLDIFKL
jgi:hypothetical protein